SRKRSKIAHIAGFGPQNGTVARRAGPCADNVIQVVDVARRAVIAAGQNPKVAHARASRPHESFLAIRARRVSRHMAVTIDAERLSAVVARQQRNPPKAARRRPHKWNDGASNVRSASDFPRVIDSRSGSIFAAAKATQIRW